MLGGIASGCKLAGAAFMLSTLPAHPPALRGPAGQPPPLGTAAACPGGAAAPVHHPLAAQPLQGVGQAWNAGVGSRPNIASSQVRARAQPSGPPRSAVPATSASSRHSSHLAPSPLSRHAVEAAEVPAGKSASPAPSPCLLGVQQRRQQCTQCIRGEQTIPSQWYEQIQLPMSPAAATQHTRTYATAPPPQPPLSGHPQQIPCCSA